MLTTWSDESGRQLMLGFHCPLKVTLQVTSNDVGSTMMEHFGSKDSPTHVRYETKRWKSMSGLI